MDCVARLHRRSSNVIPTPCMQIPLGQAATRVGAATSMEGRSEMHIWQIFFFAVDCELKFLLHISSHAILEEL